MTRPRVAPPKETSLQDFVEAVLAFSDDPDPVNLERYLAASRSLDKSRLAEQEAPWPGARTTLQLKKLEIEPLERAAAQG
jgi:hypothetical protein